MVYDVPLIPQTSEMSCWAASIAMILGWKYRMSIPDESIARNPGGLSYMTSYAKGLDPNDKYILHRNGFRLEPPLCYTPKGILLLLRKHGPLWVATWAPGPHIRVVTGMKGNNVSINDPAPVNIGSKYSMSFSKFFGAMEKLGSREMKQPSPVYVAYLAR
jgi:ABC-type bacteriocin/lantibiotic exporter with double-glycine peptidase domain